MRVANDPRGDKHKPIVLDSAVASPFHALDQPRWRHLVASVIAATPELASKLIGYLINVTPQA